MVLLDYADWVDKYGWDELDEHLNNMNGEPSPSTEEQDEWLEDAYEGYISGYQCQAYDSYKDDKQ
jgi:hypothetical protein